MSVFSAARRLAAPCWPPAGRIALFCAALAPASIWLISPGALAKPWATTLWCLVCAALLAALPVRRLRLVAWVSALALPWTCAWIATVAITGMGPSNAMMASATEGAFKEVLIGLGMALSTPAFLASASLTLASLVWAFRATRQAQARVSNAVGIVFLCLLVPSSASVLDGANFLSFSQIIGPEARIAVPWFSHLAMVKEALAVRLARLAFGEVSSTAELALRSTTAASKRFDAMQGLGVLVIGESLRADAFLGQGGGPWSQALALRLRDGLGVHLPDACAGSNGTFASMPRLMTGVDVADVNGAAKNPTLLALAKAAGAKTAYINNHEIWVLPEAGHDLLQKTSSMEFNAYDEVAVEALSDFIKRTGPGAKAAILHLYGQHFYYQDRYPARLFPPEPPGLDADGLLALRYKRSVEFTVRVLLQAAAVLDAQKEPAFLVFTSDHGENLPSDKTGKHFHSGPSSGLHDTIVPSLVLWNRAFANSGKPAVLDGLAKAQGPIAHRDLANAWLALMGMPGKVLATDHPRTWGARVPGDPLGAISCATLSP
jgi:glucan phosphoethanolaminetransferase (alkaline phosphatase superfamily)